MGVTNEYERDLNAQAGLKRPGRIDLRVLQNTADAGDGHPGLQRAFRNYLHEGGMEKDLDLIGYGIKGTSVDLTNAKLQEFSNIGSVTISGTQWGYLGNSNQNVRTTDSPTFVGLTLSADVVTTSTFDGVDVGDLKTEFDTHKASTGVDHTYIDQSVVISASPSFAGLGLTGNLVLAANSITGTSVDINNVELQQLSNIGTSVISVDEWSQIANIGSSVITTSIWSQLDNIESVTIDNGQWVYVGGADQAVKIADSPTFVGLTLSADLVTTSTVDSVDIAGHDHSGANQGGTVDHVNLNSKGTNTHANIDSHISSSAIHFEQIYGTYTGDANASKIVIVGGLDIKYLVVIKTSATQKTWVKIQGLSDVNYDAIDMASGDIESTRIETDAVGYRAWGECNTSGELYTYYGLRGG